MNTNDEVVKRDFEGGLNEVTDEVEKEVLEPLIKNGDEKKRKKQENDGLISLVTTGIEIGFKEKELDAKIKLSQEKEKNNCELKEKELQLKEREIECDLEKEKNSYELKERELKLKEQEIENNKRELEDARFYKEMEAHLKEKELLLKERELELAKGNIITENFKTVGSLIEKTLISAGTVFSAAALYRTVIDGVQFTYKHDQDEVISKSAFDFLRMVVGFVKRS